MLYFLIAFIFIVLFLQLLYCASLFPFHFAYCSLPCASRARWRAAMRACAMPSSPLSRLLSTNFAREARARSKPRRARARARRCRRTLKLMRALLAPPFAAHTAPMPPTLIAQRYFALFSFHFRSSFLLSFHFASFDIASHFFHISSIRFLARFDFLLAFIFSSSFPIISSGLFHYFSFHSFISAFSIISSSSSPPPFQPFFFFFLHFFFAIYFRADFISLFIYADIFISFSFSISFRLFFFFLSLSFSAFILLH